MLLLGSQMDNKKKCFIDNISLSPIQNGKIGLILRLQSETATYFASGYYRHHDYESWLKEMNKIEAGSWVTVPSLREKVHVDEKTGYHYLSFNSKEMIIDGDTKQNKDAEIKKIEDSFEPLSERLSFPIDGNKSLKISVLRVGQGDLILVRFPSGEGIVVDANYNALNKDRVVRYIKEFFDGRTPCALLITHKHLDHIRYAVEIIQEFKIKECWWPVCDYHRHAGPTVRRVLEGLTNSGVRVMAIKKDMSYTNGANFTISIRYPASRDSGHSSNPNDHSIILSMEFGGRNIILGADLTLRGWDIEYGNNLPQEIDFLKVPHHGSSEGLGGAAIAKTRIINSVTSCAQHNRYQHPHCEPLRTYINNGEHRLTCLTAKGAIEYEIGRQGKNRVHPHQSMKKHLDCQSLQCFASSNADCIGCSK